jgi:hypothetical protein
MREHDRLESWRGVPERLEATQQLAASLGTWRAWAHGQPITNDQIIATINQLDEHAATRNTPGTRFLTDIMYRWAQHHCVDVDANRQVAISRGIELDLDI